jgi:hypothetical protein
MKRLDGVWIVLRASLHVCNANASCSHVLMCEHFISRRRCFILII